MDKELRNRIHKIAVEAAQKLNYEIVDIEMKNRQKQFFITVYIYKDGGISFQDCEQMSELMAIDLDREEDLPTPYYLEVSSPGLDRPLKTDRDLERNLHEKLMFKLLTPMDGKKQFEGKIKNFNEETIIITDEKGTDITLLRKNISKIMIVIEF